MKRYLLFSGSNYYPSGGMNDFRGSFDTIEEAQAEPPRSRWDERDWSHIADSEQDLAIILEHTPPRPGRPAGWYAPDKDED